VRARDRAGNTDASPAQRSWTVDLPPAPPPPDRTPPATSITAGPSGTSATRSASFSFGSSEAGSAFECRLDAGAWGACSSPKAYANLGEGRHTFFVRARDRAGNTDASPAQRTWTVDVPAPPPPPPTPDRTPPATTITSGPSGTIGSRAASFGFSSSEAGSAFECRLDAGAWGGCASPKAYANLGEGAHTFAVRARDRAGNTDATPAQRTWTVDLPAPPPPLPPPPPPPPPPSGANVYVSPTGSDGGACTAGAPCRSFARAYAVAAAGHVIQVADGSYGDQKVPAGTKRVTFRGVSTPKLRTLDNEAANVTFDGFDVDAGFAKVVAFYNGGDNSTFRNGRIGNVTDEKGALVSAANFTFDRVVFHDVRVTNSQVHNECVYAIVVPGMTVRNSSFHACATMDLFFTFGTWWNPKPPAYANVTLENNVFGHATMIGAGSWHYYSLAVGYTGDPATGGGTMAGWVVRNNTFETPASIGDKTASGGSRWVGNLGDWSCIAGMTYRYNVGKKCAASDKSVSPAGSSPTRAAPLGWANPAAWDFRLTATSPALNAADPNDHPATDRDGKARGAAPDAGAYER
jgi:hypothetical protein